MTQIERLNRIADAVEKQLGMSTTNANGRIEGKFISLREYATYDVYANIVYRYNLVCWEYKDGRIANSYIVIGPMSAKFALTLLHDLRDCKFRI